jgi:dTDP-4-amino-4,6-dideoxygalactose transaminase
MKHPLFYSLPPAGQKIPLSALMRCLDGIQEKSNSTPIDRFKKYLGSEYLHYLSSGRAALWLALKVFARLRPGRNEVIIPAYSCPSVVSATLKAGLKPILCDVNLNDFGFLYGELEKKIGAETLAVIVVHLYGYPARIDEIQRLCRDHDAYLVEDAAQAFGNDFLDSPHIKLGLAGDAGFFSFGRGKPLNMMHGGLLATKSSDVYEEVNNMYEGLNGCSGYQNLNYCVSLSLYALFSNPYLYWVPQRIPFLNLGRTVFEPEFATSRGMDPAAALAGVMLDKIEEEKDVRRGNSTWYSDHLRDIFSDGRRVPDEYPYLRYPLLVFDGKKRTRILDALVSKGTGATGFYPAPLNELPGLRECLKDNTPYKNARIMSQSVITLPVHSRVRAEDRKNIRDIISQGLHED